MLEMSSTGLRELKKARTRRLIAETAARLFAERGYEQVSVRDVAREAELAEQTVYNYFPTKEHLVTDRDQQIQDRLSDLVRTRPPGVTPPAAIREFVLGDIAGIRDTPPEIWRGELGYLTATSPTVHRLALELIDRQAVALANAIGDTTAVPLEVARLHVRASACGGRRSRSRSRRARARRFRTRRTTRSCRGSCSSGTRNSARRSQ